MRFQILSRLRERIEGAFAGMKRPAPAPDPLDEILFSWNARDRFTVRDLLNGGVSIFGRSGSGKTSSSGKLLGKCIVRYPKSGGLILAAKPEDLYMWQAIFEAAGRSDDLIVFGPEHPARFNGLDYVIQSGGHTREVTRYITVVGETLRSSDNKGGESADFWEREQDRMIYNAVEIIKLATGAVSAPNIQRFIIGAAASAEQLKSEEWRKGFHCQTIRAALDKPKSPIEQHDFDLASDYWLGEYPVMADKTRSSILTGVMGILHVFNVGVVRELVSTTTNVSPDDLLAGKVVLVNMAPSEWGDNGSLVAASWKYLTQRRVLRRAAKDGDCINVIWADEANQFVNSYDAHYLAQCRSHMGCMVYLTQSLHSYYSAMHGQRGRHQADALLTNFHHKIFHALGDAQTAEWASGLIGKDRQTFIGGSMGPVENIYDEIMGRQKVTTSTSEHFDAILQPRIFQNGLRTGGKANGLLCDGIVVRSGEPFSTGENHLMCEFSQKG